MTATHYSEAQLVMIGIELVLILGLCGTNSLRGALAWLGVGIALPVGWFALTRLLH